MEKFMSSAVALGSQVRSYSYHSCAHLDIAIRKTDSKTRAGEYRGFNAQTRLVYVGIKASSHF